MRASLRLELVRQLAFENAPELLEEQVVALFEASDDPKTLVAPLLDIYLEAGQMKLAERLAEEVLADAAATYLAAGRAGEVMLRLGRFDKAADGFEQAARGASNPLPLWIEGAEALREVGALNQTERFLEFARDAAPQSPASQLYLGLFYLENSDLEGALMAFDEVRANAYQPLQSLKIVAQALVARSELEAAKGYLEALMALPVAKVDKLRALAEVMEACATEQARMDLLLKYGAQLTRDARSEVAMGSVLTEILLEAGELEQALAFAEDLRLSFPQEAQAWMALAQAAVAQGEYARAHDAARLAANYASPEQRGAARLSLAAVYLAEGQAEAAAALGLAALSTLDEEAHTERSAAYALLARSYEQMGESERGALFERALGFVAE